MCMINEMNGRIHELEQMVREKDIALMGLQAKNQGLQAELSVAKRERDSFRHLKDSYQKEAELYRRSSESKQDHLTKHAVHAARSQLCREIEELFDAHGPLTAEQVLDLISADKEVAA